MVAKMDFALPNHPHLDVPNLHVIKLMGSLKSRGYVNEKFNWQWFYFTLTNEVLHRPAVSVLVKRDRQRVKKGKGKGLRDAYVTCVRDRALSTCVSTCTCRPTSCPTR